MEKHSVSTNSISFAVRVSHRLVKNLFISDRKSCLAATGNIVEVIQYRQKPERRIIVWHKREKIFTKFITATVVSHFRVSPSLCFKARLHVKPLM